MRYLLQSTARNVMVFMTDADHVTGAAALTLTITESKNGGAFSSTSPTVTDRGDGWYQIALTTTNTNTLGDYCLHITASGADPTDIHFDVIAVNLADSVRGGMTALPNAAAEASGGLYTRGTGAGQIRQQTNGQIDVNVERWRNGVTGTLINGTDVPAAVTTMAANSLTASALASDAVTEIAAAISIPSAATVADAVWDEAISGHLTAGSTGAALNSAGSGGSAPTAAEIADAGWDEAISGHLSVGSTGEALNSAGGGITVQNIVDGVWNALAVDYTIDGSMGANLQSLADAALIWPTPVGGGTTALTIIQRAMAIADMHDNFVTETDWLNWLNQEQYALRLFLARAGWTLPFDTTVATMTTSGWDLSTDGASAVSVAKTAAGHYVFTPTLAAVMAVVCIHENRSGDMRLLHLQNDVDFLRQTITGGNTTGHANSYRLRMYGNEIHADFFPSPVTGESYYITYLSAPVPITATTQSIALPMGWEERLVLGMARRALVKEESDTSAVEKLMREMDSQIEQLCWNRVMSEAPRVRNTDPNVARDTYPVWQQWFWL